jgi:hypothetical protein
LFVSKVLGEFPENDDRALISLGVVERAQYRHAEMKPDVTDRHYFGVDVARFGADKTVITHIHGNKVIESRVLVKRATTEVVGEVTRMVSDLVHKEGVITVDATGIGAGVVDGLRDAQAQKTLPWTFTVHEINFGNACENEEHRAKFVNVKAQIFVDLAESLANKLALPEDNVYQSELPTIIYKFDSKGRYMIEGKDEYKKRTGRGSPDHADSLALAVCGQTLGVMPDFSEKHIPTGGKTYAPGLGGESLW